MDYFEQSYEMGTGGLPNEVRLRPAVYEAAPPQANWMVEEDGSAKSWHKIKKKARKEAERIAKRASKTLVVHDKYDREQERKEYSKTVDKMKSVEMDQGPEPGEGAGGFGEFYDV